MLPKYEQIKQDLLQEIKDHKFIPGDKFYSEADIKRMYSVSSITAVKALNELTSAGYLYRIQGKGTFVSKAKVSHSVKFSDIELHSLDQEKVKVLAVEEGNDPEILKELGLAASASYYRIKRVRYFGDVPFLVHITHLPKKLMKEPIAKNLNRYASVYERVRKDFAIDLFSLASVETNEIVFPDDAELLNLLQLSFREPAVKQVKHSYLADGSVAEYIVSYKHWKYFKTKIEVEPA
ncbi:GntR family transcriptional regulator [Enterococcus casseliflavus]|uniref:GntR family transcriptional regulator n=1 Tax=Enterococcus casseliflavus TaxID=37734 RepID=UPI0035DE755F